MTNEIVNLLDLRQTGIIKDIASKSYDAVGINNLPIQDDGFIHVSSDETWTLTGTDPIIFNAPIYIEPQVTHFQLQSENLQANVYIDYYGTGEAFINTDYLNVVRLEYITISSPNNDLFNLASYTILYYSNKTVAFTPGQVVTGADSSAYGTIVKDRQITATSGMLTLRSESGTFQEEVITDALGGTADLDITIYRSNQGFLLCTINAFYDIKALGTIQDGSCFVFINIFQYLRQGFVFDNCYSIAININDFRNFAITVPYTGRTPDQDFTTGSTVTESVIGSTGIVYRDTGTALYLLSVTGHFNQGNTITDGTVTATIAEHEHNLIAFNVNTATTFGQFNSNFLYLPHGSYGFNFDSGLVFNYITVVGSTGISDEENFFYAGSLDQDTIGVYVKSSPPLQDSSVTNLSTVKNNAVATDIVTQDIPVKFGLSYTEQSKTRTLLDVATGNVTYLDMHPIKCYSTQDFFASVASGGHVFDFELIKGNLTDYGIASFADAGGGQITVTTSKAHGMSNSDEIFIIGTTNYNAYYIISNVSTYTFEITAAFVETETGYYEKLLSYTKVSVEIQSIIDARFSLKSIVDLKYNDYINTVVRNTSSNVDITIEDTTKILFATS